MGGLALYFSIRCLPSVNRSRHLKAEPQKPDVEPRLLPPDPRPRQTSVLVIKRQKEAQELGDLCSLSPASDTNDRLVCNLEQIISIL